MDNDQEKKSSLALCFVVQQSAPVIFSGLEKIFTKFQVGGWFFGARKLSGELARQTRYEVISYLTALETILLDQWPSRTEEAWKIRDFLEENVFSMKLEDARPAYDVYREHFYSKFGDSSFIPGCEVEVHSLFAQRVTTHWMKETGWLPASSEVTNSLSSDLIDLTSTAEKYLRAGLEGVWPKQPDL